MRSSCFLALDEPHAAVRKDSFSENPGGILPCGDAGTKAAAEATKAKRVTIWKVFMMYVDVLDVRRESGALLMETARQNSRSFCSTSGLYLSVS